MANGKHQTVMSPLSAGLAGAAVGAVGSAIAIAFMHKDTRKKVAKQADTLRQQATNKWTDMTQKGAELVNRTTPKGGRSQHTVRGRKNIKRKAKQKTASGIKH